MRWSKSSVFELHVPAYFAVEVQCILLSHNMHTCSFKNNLVEQLCWIAIIFFLLVDCNLVDCMVIIAADLVVSFYQLILRLVAVVMPVVRVHGQNII